MGNVIVMNSVTLDGVMQVDRADQTRTRGMAFSTVAGGSDTPTTRWSP